MSAAMVSLPTAAEGGEGIATFYRAHVSVIVVQQVVGLLALAAFIVFALSLPRNRWLRLALWVFVVTELVTNVIPLLIVGSNPTSDTAHSLTLAEDLADDAFSIAIALFVSAATLGRPMWLRIAGYVVAVASAARAVADPAGISALDQVAPIAFVVFILIVSVWLVVTRTPAPGAEHTA